MAWNQRALTLLLSQLLPECRLVYSPLRPLVRLTPLFIVSERHLISMTTRKDMIPSQRKLNSISASFALGDNNAHGHTHTDMNCSVPYTGAWHINRLQAQSWTARTPMVESENKLKHDIRWRYIRSKAMHINHRTARQRLVQSNKSVIRRNITDSFIHSLGYLLVCRSGSVFTCGNSLAWSIPFPSRIITKSRSDKEKTISISRILFFWKKS